MRRSRTTRHEILGNAALFFFSVTVSGEIYTQGSPPHTARYFEGKGRVVSVGAGAGGTRGWGPWAAKRGRGDALREQDGATQASPLHTSSTPAPTGTKLLPSCHEKNLPVKRGPLLTQPFPLRYDAWLNVFKVVSSLPAGR